MLGVPMQIPLEITFHHIEKDAIAEKAIRGHVARLEQIHDRIIACRVRVDKRVDPTQDTIPPVVRIELSVPGKPDIVVAHEPDRLQRKFQTPDLHNAINEAFRIAARKLATYKDQRTDYTAPIRHEAANEFRGQVAELAPDQDHGFVLTKEGGLLYFHRNSVLTGDFDSLHRGAEISYVEEIGDTGPIATKVRMKAR
jgi:cold shock CspA family protein/ribosome-associated translation inhibitor RaiA